MKMAELAEEDFVTPPTSPVPEEKSAEKIIFLSSPDGENASPLAEAEGASCATQYPPHDGVNDVVVMEALFASF